MGCTASSMNVVNPGLINKDIFKHMSDKTNFTDTQIDLIKSSWKLIDDKTEFGIRIMIRQRSFLIFELDKTHFINEFRSKRK